MTRVAEKKCQVMWRHRFSREAQSRVGRKTNRQVSDNVSGENLSVFENHLDTRGVPDDEGNTRHWPQSRVLCVHLSGGTAEFFREDKWSRATRDARLVMATYDSVYDVMASQGEGASIREAR